MDTIYIDLSQIPDDTVILDIAGCGACKHADLDRQNEFMCTLRDNIIVRSNQICKLFEE